MLSIYEAYIGTANIILSLTLSLSHSHSLTLCPSFSFSLSLPPDLFLNFPFPEKVMVTLNYLETYLENTTLDKRTSSPVLWWSRNHSFPLIRLCKIIKHVNHCSCHSFSSASTPRLFLQENQIQKGDNLWTETSASRHVWSTECLQTNYNFYWVPRHCRISLCPFLFFWNEF